MADVYVYKNVQKLAAVCEETQAELDTLAAVVASTMRGVAAGHGSLPSRVEVTSGKVDRFVGIKHDDMSAIEFGGVQKDGRVIKGLHILTRTANLFGSID